MHKLLWLLILSFFVNCNNSRTTTRPNDLDHTDVDDTTSAHARFRQDSLPKADTSISDSLKR